MRTSQTRIVAALITVLACLLMAGAALAQGEQKINVQYAGTELGKVLETFKRFDPAFAYTLPPGYESKAITAGLVDVTIEEALTIVLDQVGLRFFKDNNLYSIREKTERGGGRVDRPITTAYGTPVITTRPTQPTAQAGGAAASTATGEKKEGEDERANLPIRMIKVRFADPALLSDIFGGDIIEGGYGGGSGGGYGSSSGGYSSGSGGYSSGSSRGGSSRGGSSRSNDGGSSSRSSRSSGSSRGSSRSNY